MLLMSSVAAAQEGTPDVLIIGASVSSEMLGTKSPGRLIAERLGASYAILARPGAKLHSMLPSDAQLRAPRLVVSLDGFYWYSGLREDCEQAAAALQRLLAVRADKLTILGTVPFDSFGHRCINPLLRERCRGACKLVELDGALKPPGLHPGPEYMTNVADRIENLL